MVRSALLARISNHEGDTFLILRDAARRPLLRMRFFLDPHGEERGNAARLEPGGQDGPS